MVVITRKWNVQLEKFRYFRSVVTEDWRCEEKVKPRIAMAKKAIS